MDETPRAQVLLVLASVLGRYACAAIPVSHYSTAKPLGKGAITVAAGAQLPKSTLTGTDQDRSEGAPVELEYPRAFPLGIFDVEAHYGLTDRLEISAQVFWVGAELGLRHTWVDRDGFKAAIGLNAGAFNGSEAPVMGDLAPGTEYASVGGRYVEIPATFSIHKGDNVAVFFGPVAHYFNVLRIESVSSSDAQEDAHLFAHRGRFWQTGAFIGACLSGKTLQLTPGVTVYLEPDKYPVRNFLGGAVRPYPWVGITVLARSKKP